MMSFIADLHIHSSYSRSTSPSMGLPELCGWAQLKGISLIGTGDFTHPAWFSSLCKSLSQDECGLYKLKTKEKHKFPIQVPEKCRSEVFIVPTAEISCIYKRGGRTRKVHNIVIAESLQSAEKIGRSLGQIGNIRSDGRPILGLDSEKLLDIVLAAGDGNMLVPAHAWTPHFSVFGAFSGFDSLEECFGSLTPHVRAIETGLSSDPAMNRRISALDDVAMISCSDAHSPAKLGREATIISGEPSLTGLFGAIRGTRARIDGTIEFFPEEGKYHYDGHRPCKVRLTPDETAGHGGRCPSCGGRVTVGVLSRANELADRKKPRFTAGSPSVEYLVPMMEIIAECFSTGVAAKKVSREYFRLLELLGPELHIARTVPVPDLIATGNRMFAEAIKRVRAGKLNIQPGYDGEFGKISIFTDADRQNHA